MKNNAHQKKSLLKTKKETVTIHDLVVEVSYKNMKNMRLYVKYPDGKVCLSVPKYVKDSDIKHFIVDKSSWIKKKQSEIGQKNHLTHQYETGEIHDLFGAPHRLEVIITKKRHVVVLSQNTIQMEVLIKDGKEERQKLMETLYRDALNEALPPLIKKWQSILKVHVKEWRIKKMKTRWGTCNIQDQRIWINLELAKRNLVCLEYIVVHEMMHLLERYHNERFYALMDQFYPDWKQVRQMLKKSHS